MLERVPLGLRAAIAAVFLIAFFALAVASAVALTWLGIKLLGSVDAIQGRGAGLAVLGGAGCLLAAGVIVWSALPRIDRFVPPGPEITPEDAPELFRGLADVAAATGQAMPRHVYLVPEVNAFVTERGGLMGLGSRRVMGIGLPLLTLLDVSGLRGVIAHELGHFHGGDTRLGPWLYKTRAAVERTIINLMRAQGATPDGEAQFVALLLAAVRKPFQWFAMVFIRTTQAICRRQELTADELAARIVGAPAMIRGLKRVHGGAAAFDSFMQRDLVPVLTAGFMAPIADGFERFLRTAGAAQIDKAIAKEMVGGAEDPYDSHPPLRERVQAIEAIAPALVAEDARPAAALVGDLAALEERVASFLLADSTRVHPLIGWDEIGAKVLEPRWRETVRGLAGFDLATLPTDRDRLRVLMRSVGHPAGGMTEYEPYRLAMEAYGAYLAVALIDVGYRISAPPGAEVTLAREGIVVEPFRRASDYLFGNLPPDQWAAWLASVGLVSASPTPPSAA